MNATDRFEVPVSLNLEGFGAALRFETPDEIIKWLTKERDWLTGLQTASGRQPAAEPFARSNFANVLKAVNVAINQTNAAIQSTGEEKALSLRLLNTLHG